MSRARTSFSFWEKYNFQGFSFMTLWKLPAYPWAERSSEYSALLLLKVMKSDHLIGLMIGSSCYTANIFSPNPNHSTTWLWGILPCPLLHYLLLVSIKLSSPDVIPLDGAITLVPIVSCCIEKATGKS